MKEMTVAGITHFVTEAHEQKAIALGLRNSDIRTRLKNGWTTDEAYSAPKGMRLEDYREIQQIKAMERRNKKQIKKLYAEKERKAKPHLYDGTPQKHSRCDYVENLMNTSAFPKIKVDYFNNTQLV
ncbi:SA1788 family PVL leukocidin-associated protein [Staphylococcus sp. 47.1]|uniref:SA1788 family PVL leukocidin-associated protein n=1 Tax=Staphylococcus sp. 47.1 TaxID=1929484 RepID=UPI0009FA3588|nr:SA1788 family PVL leukocidin-associated protein [Staphylococcus sp. 47.1]